MPSDLFNRGHATLTHLEYFNLWDGLDKAAGEREFPLLLAKHLSVESFDPTIFATICSPDLNTALQRLRQYKPLIGPLMLDLSISTSVTKLTMSCYGYKGGLPKSLGLGEIAFFTQLTRIATREHIEPVKITLPEMPKQLDDYEAYFGCSLEEGNQVQVHFSAKDAQKPFLTSNAAMWTYFESNLNQKLIDLDTTATTSERVRAVLMESLPAGESSIEMMAGSLAMSKRTLQRKLKMEAESYQSVLQSVRTDLADHYLEKSPMSLSEISFLLGFQDSNSFIRAFTAWKGVSPGTYRESLEVSNYF